MVKRLRHRPFTAVTRGRFSVESPKRYAVAVAAAFLKESVRKWLRGRASPCQGEGREFESRLPLQNYARLAELADALDLGSSGRPWGFKSLVAHQFRIVLYFNIAVIS